MYLGTEYHYGHRPLLPLPEAQYIKPHSQTTKLQVFSFRTTHALSLSIQPTNAVSTLLNSVIQNLFPPMMKQFHLQCTVTSGNTALSIHTLLQSNH
jgi:hypothetical protein